LADVEDKVAVGMNPAAKAMSAKKAAGHFTQPPNPAV